MDTIAIAFNYREDEVVSAQRLRFLKSVPPKIVVVIGVLATILLGLQQIWAWFQSKDISRTWYTPFYMLLIIGTVFIVSYFLAPSIDFRINPTWKITLSLFLDEDKIRITAKGRTDGFNLPWVKIKRVFVNDMAYILFWDTDRDFFILPRRIFDRDTRNFLESKIRLSTR
jgi:hypothetical protein